MRTRRIAIIMLSMLGGVYGYLLWRLVLTLDFAVMPKLALGALLAYPFMQILWLPLVYWRLEDTRPTRKLNLMLWTSFGCMALISMLLVTALVCDLALFVVRPPWLFGPRGSLFIVGAAFAMLGVGVFRALRGPKVREVAISVADLPPELEGFRIAHLSDLHIGPIIGKKYIGRVVKKTNALAPDIVAITGDMIDGDVEHLRPATSLLSKLQAPHGRYYVTGNHEYYWEAAPWLLELRRLGFETLVNEHRVIEHKGAKVVVAGIPDAWVSHHFSGAKADLGAALNGAPLDAFRVLLSHQPSVGLKAKLAGFHLQLSGHTHGGQFVPWSFMVRLFHRFAKGLYDVDGMWLYVNVGTGFWGPPVRLGTTSEIALLKLTRSVASA